MEGPDVNFPTRKLTCSFARYARSTLVRQFSMSLTNSFAVQFLKLDVTLNLLLIFVSRQVNFSRQFYDSIADS